MASLLYVAALLISAHVGAANASEVTPAPAPPVCKVVLQDNLMHAELLGHKHVDDDEAATALGWLWLLLVTLVIAMMSRRMWSRRAVGVDADGKPIHIHYDAKPYKKVPELRMV
jgi:hypothetical protein